MIWNKSIYSLQVHPFIKRSIRYIRKQDIRCRNYLQEVIEARNDALTAFQVELHMLVMQGQIEGFAVILSPNNQDAMGACFHVIADNGHRFAVRRASYRQAFYLIEVKLTGLLKQAPIDAEPGSDGVGRLKELDADDDLMLALPDLSYSHRLESPGAWAIKRRRQIVKAARNGLKRGKEKLRLKRRLKLSQSRAMRRADQKRI